MCGRVVCVHVVPRACSMVTGAGCIFATSASAYCLINENEVNDDCCFQNMDAIVKQRKADNYFGGNAEGFICPSTVTATCDADCCSYSTGYGIGCPR